MAERSLLNEILLQASKLGWRLFRNNTGQGWVGKVQRFPMATSVPIYPTDVVIRNAKPLNAGLCKGSSDLIGWKSVTITPEMVGQKIAVFVAIEAKYGTTATTKEQTIFIDNINKAGGYGKIVHGVNEL